MRSQFFGSKMGYSRWVSKGKIYILLFLVYGYTLACCRHRTMHRKNLMGKGQQSGSSAAILVAIITLLIIFYILFLPPEDRAALLGTSSSGGSSGTTYPSDTYNEDLPGKGEVIFTINPGHFDYRSLDEYEYTLPTVTLRQTTDSAMIAQATSFTVKKGWFENVEKPVYFEIADYENTKDISLAVTVSKRNGRVIVELNGREIYDDEPTSSNIGPLQLPKVSLNSGENVLVFKTSPVGMSFWDTNGYAVEHMSVQAKIYDYSQSASRSTFSISPDESENIEKATLRFYPDCMPNEVGKLTIDINDRNIFSGIPDCGIINRQAVTVSSLNVGLNKIEFATDWGSYLVDQVSITTELEEPVQPTYYFDLHENLFKKQTKDYDRCGEIDGICPEDCDEDIDKDCCFKEYDKAFWCDVKTDLLDDRCVGNLEESYCHRCRSGYEDDRGDPADMCEDRCGDDDDDFCPVGCNSNLDKDCCFAKDGDQYWCDDLPTNGLDYTCVNSVSYDSCQVCVTGYDGEDRDPSCPSEPEEDEEDELKSNVHVILEFKFTEKGETKEAVYYINGFESGFETRDDTYTKVIDNYVESGSNSIRLIPKSDLDIRQINVRID